MFAGANKSFWNPAGFRVYPRSIQIRGSRNKSDTMANRFKT